MVVKITIDKYNTAILESSKETLDRIDEHFTHPDYSNCWVYGKFKKERTVMMHFLIRSKGVDHMALLPIGLVPELTKFIFSQGGKYKVFDNRKFAKFEFDDDYIKKCLGYLELRPFQIEAVQKCLKHPNAIIKSTTASGKTEIFIALCKLMKVKTLILFARIDLAHQTLRRMKDAGLDAGIVQGNNIDENHDIIMATVQSSHKLQNQYEMVIVDECHRAVSEQYQAILRSGCFKYRYGFSATPFTKNKLHNTYVRQFLGDLIFESKAKELIKEGRIAHPYIRFVPVTMPKNILEVSNWRFAEKLGIVENQYRNKLIAKICSRLKGQTLILVIKISQGEELNKLIPNSYLLYGESKVKERKELVRRFDSGEQFYLIASTIFDEGIDIKTVNNVVICGGGASFIKTLQRLGRGLRTTDTKKHVNIYDFYDYTNPLLTKHSKKRISAYNQEGFDDVEIWDNQALLEFLKKE